MPKRLDGARRSLQAVPRLLRYGRPTELKGSAGVDWLQRRPRCVRHVTQPRLTAGLFVWFVGELFDTDSILPAGLDWTARVPHCGG